MNTVDLIEKSKTEPLSQEELGTLIKSIEVEMQELKEKNPREYLKFVKELNAIVKELNKGLSTL